LISFDPKVTCGPHMFWVGRPPNHVRRLYGDFEYQAASWDKPRRVVAKVEWPPGELFPRMGFVVTNLPMEPG